MNDSNRFPPGWDGQRVRAVLSHYESQTEEEVTLEDEAAFGAVDQTFIRIPNALVPTVRELVARYKAA